MVTNEELNKLIASVDKTEHLDTTTSEYRKNICNSCDKKETKLDVAWCTECKCLIPFKVAFKRSTCPLSKW
jgi:hypothetical protein